MPSVPNSTADRLLSDMERFVDAYSAEFKLGIKGDFIVNLIREKAGASIATFCPSDWYALVDDGDFQGRMADAITLEPAKWAPILRVKFHGIFLNAGIRETAKELFERIYLPLCPKPLRESLLGSVFPE